MLVDDLYAELYAIAGHRGPLNEDAVQGATMILAMPRYAKSVHTSPAALLVEDLKRVIESITNNAAAEDEPEAREKPLAPHASRFFRDHARQYFSLEGVGETITERRLFGRKNLNGSVATWTNRGVVYRVAAGLLDLWAAPEARDVPAESPATAPYVLDVVRFTHSVNGSALYPLRDELHYELRLVTPGPHLLLLPFPSRHTQITHYSPEQTNTYPAPQLVQVDMGASKRTALLFGAHREPGEHIRAIVTHRPRHMFSGPMVVQYRVGQPVGTLWLGGYHSSAHNWKWQVTEDGSPVPEASVSGTLGHGSWACNNPKLGATYQLWGTRRNDEKPQEARQKSRRKRLARQGSTPAELDKL